METFELYIEPPKVNPINGRFRKGHIPFNRGIPMRLWMDNRKIKRVIKCLDIGRKIGNHGLPANNRKKVVTIKDGMIMVFSSMKDAERILRQKGIKISARNISSVCCKKEFKVGKYKYIRKKAGGFRWVFASEIDNNLINKL